MKDFEIEDGVLEKYNGNDSHVVIPDGVKKIGDWAFRPIVNGGCINLTNIKIPNSVTCIGSCAFQDCINLTNINIPNRVKSIGNFAFKECTSLTSIEIPNSVTSIGQYAFYGCKSLTSVKIPSGVTSIGSNAFRYCTRLTSIVIPNSVTSIGQYAFEKLPKIKPQYNANGSLRAFKAFYDDWTSGRFQFAVGKSYHQDGVIECCHNGFHACTNPLSVFNYYAGDLNNLRFAEVELSGDFDWLDDNFAASDIKIVRELTVSELAEIYNSFVNVNMEDFEIKDGFLSKYKGNKSHVVIPYSVRVIGTSAFDNCISLTSIEIPSTVTGIGEMAFTHCPNLTSIKVSSSNSVYDSRENCNAIIETKHNKLIVGCKNTVIPNSVTYIGARAFAHCPNLTSIEIPNSVTYIDDYAFFDCYSLTHIVIPNRVKTIGGAAFAHCISLSNIKIPKSVSYIGFNAFEGIKKVKPQYNANNTLRAFMAFHKDWSWRYSQYALGKSYHKDGKIVCNLEHGNGFLACTNPLDVFNDYNGETDRYNFAEVELSGEMDWDKYMVAASDIKIVRKLTASQLAEIYNSMEKA